MPQRAAADDDDDQRRRAAQRPAAGSGNADTVHPRHHRQGGRAGPGRLLTTSARQQVIGNIYQNLLSVPAGGNKPEPDAAESCEFIGSEDVRLQAQAGPEVLQRRPADGRGRQVLARPHAQDRGPDRPVHAAGLARLGRGDRSDDRDDEAQQGRRDLARSSSRTTSRRSSRTRSTRPTRCRPTDKVDRLRPVQAGQVHARTSRPSSRRTRSTPARTRPQTPNFIVQYFDQASALKLAIEQGDVDVAYRSAVADRPRGAAQAAATASRSSTAPAPRSATSSSTSRRSRSTTSRSARRSPRASTATRSPRPSTRAPSKPLYSTVPAAFPGAKESFKDAFGDPDPAKAKAILDEAGVSTPVTLDGWYTPSRYGAGRGRHVERDQAPARRQRTCSRSTSTRPSGTSTRKRRSTRARTTSTASAGSRTSRTPTTT